MHLLIQCKQEFVSLKKNKYIEPFVWWVFLTARLSARFLRKGCRVAALPNIEHNELCVKHTKDQLREDFTVDNKFKYFLDTST